jgi:hypothetical protein
MPVYRYKRIFINIQELTTLVPGALVLLGSGPPIFIDINAPTPSKADLDSVMSGLGWDYITQDPPTTPTLDARTDPPLNLDVSAGGIFVLTPPQATRKFIVLTGNLLNNTTIEFPAVPGVDWVIRNNVVLGGFTVQVKVTGSILPITTINGTHYVWSNGIDLRRIAPLVP